MFFLETLGKLGEELEISCCKNACEEVQVYHYGSKEVHKIQLVLFFKFRDYGEGSITYGIMGRMQ